MKSKDLGIWMDHSEAFITPIADPITSRHLVSSFTHEDKVSSMYKSESIAHHKEQHEQAAYYKELLNVIIHYDRVLLFGPTTAKAELINLIRENPLFKHIPITVETKDKMTEQEQHQFVINHFTKS